MWGLTVSYNVSNAVLVAVVGRPFIEENSGRSIGHKTPVLHGTHGLETRILAQMKSLEHIGNKWLLTNS